MEIKSLVKDTIETYLNKYDESKKEVRSIMEAIESFDFLGMEEEKKKEESLKILNSKEFQVTFINDIINEFNNKIKFKDIDVIYDSSQIDDELKDGEKFSLEYNVSLKYLYKDNVINITLFFSGTDIDYKLESNEEGEQTFTDLDWNDINIHIFNNDGDEVDFSWLDKSPQIKSRIIKKFIEPTLDFEVKMR